MRNVVKNDLDSAIDFSEKKTQKKELNSSHIQLNELIWKIHDWLYN